MHVIINNYWCSVMMIETLISLVVTRSLGDLWFPIEIMINFKCPCLSMHGLCL